MAKISGSIRRINYYNAQNGYTVALFELEKDSVLADKVSVVAKKGRLFGKYLTVVGTFDHQVTTDEEFLLTGNYVTDPNYGLQFKFERFERVGENTIQGVISYFASPLFPGIGLKTAKLIVETLGVDAAEIIARDPEALKCCGISDKNADTIYEIIKDNEQNQKTIIYFLNLGVSMEFCHRIVHAFGSDAIDIVEANPYILMERIERFGFKKNDAMVVRMGIPLNSPIRLEALIKYILVDAIYQNGNSYIDKSELYRLVVKYLEDIPLTKVVFEDVVIKLCQKQKLYVDTNNRCFDYSLWQNEQQLAKEIVRLLNNPEQKIEIFKQEDIQREYDSLTSSSDIEYNDLQKKAILTAFSEPLMIITGGPGTGKTTIVKAIIRIFTSLKNNTSSISDIALLAPTGRAAKRLKEITNIDAKTIHKFLGYQGENYFEKGPNNPTTERLIIVDEASMMDLPLAARLFSSLNPEARVIIVGDVDQLPSVGPGQVLKDLIDTREIRLIRLHKIHRQAENSQIIHLAHDVNEGLISENILEDFPDRAFISSSEETLLSDLTNVVRKLLNEGASFQNNLQILAPMYRHSVGINAINECLQQEFNPLGEFGECPFMGKNYRIGDRVIQLVNRSEKQVMNGDIGQITSFCYQNGEIHGVNVKYDFGVVSYNNEEMEDLNLAYAISIHKSQGSEFPIVIMPFVGQYYYMLKRKLIYTGMTRAKEKLILLGEIDTFVSSVKRLEKPRDTILVAEIKKNIYQKAENQPKAPANTLGEVVYDDLTPYDFEK